MIYMIYIYIYIYDFSFPPIGSFPIYVATRVFPPKYQIYHHTPLICFRNAGGALVMRRLRLRHLRAVLRIHTPAPQGGEADRNVRRGEGGGGNSAMHAPVPQRGKA